MFARNVNALISVIQHEICFPELDIPVFSTTSDVPFLIKRTSNCYPYSHLKGEPADFHPCSQQNMKSAYCVYPWSMLCQGAHQKTSSLNIFSTATHCGWLFFFNLPFRVCSNSVISTKEHLSLQLMQIAVQ